MLFESCFLYCVCLTAKDGFLERKKKHDIYYFDIWNDRKWTVSFFSSLRLTLWCLWLTGLKMRTLHLWLVLILCFFSRLLNFIWFIGFIEFPLIHLTIKTIIDSFRDWLANCNIASSVKDLWPQWITPKMKSPHHFLLVCFEVDTCTHRDSLSRSVYNEYCCCGHFLSRTDACP